MKNSHGNPLKMVVIKQVQVKCSGCVTYYRHCPTNVRFSVNLKFFILSYNFEWYKQWSQSMQYRRPSRGNW